MTLFIITRHTFFKIILNSWHGIKWECVACHKYDHKNDYYLKINGLTSYLKFAVCYRVAYNGVLPHGV